MSEHREWKGQNSGRELDAAACSSAIQEARALREENAALRNECKRISEESEALLQEAARLRLELAALRKRYDNAKGVSRMATKLSDALRE